MALLILALHEAGGYWTLENPAGSYIFFTDELVYIMSLPGSRRVQFHQCEYLLRPPDFSDGGPDLRVRKDTIIIGNLPGLESLERRCQKDHVHAHAFGSARVGGKTVARAAAAGAYPRLLCTALAGLVRKAL